MAIVTVSNNGNAVTTSLAIASGVDVQHKNILELIRKNLSDFSEFGGVAFETRTFKTNGGIQDREVAIINEQHATLLMTYMRNSEIVRRFKKRLVKAFFDLSKEPARPAELSRMDILNMAIEAEQENERLTAKVIEDTPKVQFHDSVVVALDSISVGDAAKIIGTGRNRLLALLRQKGWVTRRNEPYQQTIESGLMDVKMRPWEHPTQGLQRSVTPLVTGKGLAKLQKLWSDRVAA